MYNDNSLKIKHYLHDGKKSGQLYYGIISKRKIKFNDIVSISRMISKLHVISGTSRTPVERIIYKQSTVRNNFCAASNISEC